jgi:hypothetical protein
MFDTIYQPRDVVQRQDAMKSPRWLLPFTHEVDMRAIEFVVRLAENVGATLVAVAHLQPNQRSAPGAYPAIERLPGGCATEDCTISGSCRTLRGFHDRCAAESDDACA